MVKARFTWSPKTLAVLVAAAAAVTLGAATYAADAWQRLENDSIDLRFSVRKPARPSDVVVVAIDDKTFSDLQLQWPFPRALHAELIDRLHRSGARVIVYDVQFTEPTDPRDDRALYKAVGRARRVVLATTEVDAAGHTNVLGGDANLRQADALAAASNLPVDPGGVIRRYPYALRGLPSLAVAAAKADGHPLSRGRFSRGGALIDFRGPPGALSTVSFSDVLRGHVPARNFAGKIVVVGATAPTLQDVHPTSTASSSPMTGPEIQANAIWTALHGNPLQPAPSWMAWLAILLGGAAAPLASLRFRVLVATLFALAFSAMYLVLGQIAFASGSVLVLSYPLAACAIGTVGMVVANYVSAFIERNAFSQQLHESQLELIQRLAQAVESRDTETGDHIKRIGVLCQRLAVAVGWSRADAEMLKHASAMHDIGKIGVPDRVLLKPGKLDGEEWEIMRSHTTIGSDMLVSSANPLMQLAEEIARSHHERWDGTGYPAGLRGEKIPLAGRICAICDVYDALLSKRPYKGAWRSDEALSQIQLGSGTHFDPKLVAAFLEIAPELDHELAPTGATATPSTEFRPAPAA
jgi:CHASE2 domain-containing sensor protein